MRYFLSFIFAKNKRRGGEYEKIKLCVFSSPPFFLGGEKNKHTFFCGQELFFLLCKASSQGALVHLVGVL